MAKKIYKSDDNKRPKRKRISGGKWLLIGLIIGLIISGLGYLYANKNNDEGETNISVDTVESSLKEAKELTTLKYHYKNVASYENSQEFYGIKVPFSTKKFLYTYEGVINAGVNLDLAQVDIDEINKTITVSLPKAKILSHDIDEDSVMMFNEKESMFNQLKLQDYTHFRAEEEKRMNDEAIDGGLLDEAYDKAKLAIEDILNINPQIEEEYQVIVK